MALPNVTVSISDGGIGVVEGGGVEFVLVGTCTSGTIGDEQTILNVDEAKTKLGQGPLAELAATVVQIAGGPVRAIRTAGTVASTVSDNTPPAGSPLLDISGSAYDDYEGRVRIVKTGSPNTGTFQYSLDDGRTYSEETTIPAGFQLLGELKRDSGLELGFLDQSYTAADEYTFKTTPPMPNAADLVTAYAAISGSATSYSLVTIAGTFVSASSAATLFSAIDVHMTNMENSHRYAATIMDFGSDSPVDDVVSEASAVTSRRISACYGAADMASSKPFAGYAQPQVPISHAYAARVIADLVSTPAGRVRTGALTGVGGNSLTHDEAKQQNVDQEARLVTARTYTGRSGAFITRGRVKSESGSDFNEISRRRVMDLASRTVDDAMQNFINSTVRTIAGGVIDPRDASKIESDVRRSLRGALKSPKNAEGTPGHVSSCVFTIDRTNNVLSTSKLLATLSIQPLGIAEFITITVGYAVAEVVVA